MIYISPDASFEQTKEAVVKKEATLHHVHFEVAREAGWCSIGNGILSRKRLVLTMIYYSTSLPLLRAGKSTDLADNEGWYHNFPPVFENIVLSLKVLIATMLGRRCTSDSRIDQTSHETDTRNHCRGCDG